MDNDEVASYSLLIKQIPAETSAELFAIFLENTTGVEEILDTDVEFSSSGLEAVVLFRNPAIDAEQAKKQIGSKPFSGTTLEAVDPPDLNRILATHLADTVDQDTLELYFEKVLSKLESEAEVAVEYDASKHAAIATFTDISVLDGFLEYPDHEKILGDGVNLEPCGYFTSLQDLYEGTSGNEDKDSVTSEDADQTTAVAPAEQLDAAAAANLDCASARGRGSRYQRRPPRGRGGRTDNYNYRGGRGRGGGYEGGPQQDFNYRGRRPFSRPRPGGYGGPRGGPWGGPRGGPHGGPQGGAHYEGHQEKFGEDGGDQTAFPQRRNQRRYPRMRAGMAGSSENIPNAAKGSEEYAGSFEHENMDYMAPARTRQNYRSPQGYHGTNSGRAGNEAIPSLMEGTGWNEDNRSDDGKDFEGGRGNQYAGRRRTRYAPRAMNRGGRIDSSSSLQDLTEENVRQTPRQATKNIRREIEVKNETETEKCRLLVYLIPKFKKFGCSVYVNNKTHLVEINGAEEAVTQTEALVLQALCDMQSRRVPCVSTRLAKVLSGKQGMAWIRDFFRLQGQPVVFYMDQEIPHIITTSGNDAETAIALLALQIKSCDIPYTESQRAFLKSDAWMRFVDSICKSELLTVEIFPESQMIVRIVGVSGQLLETAELIRTQLSQNSVTVYEMLMSRGEMRYLKTYQKEFSKKSKVNMRFRTKENILEISGQEAAVDEAKTAAENFRLSVGCDKLKVTRPGISAAMFSEAEEIPAFTIASLEKKYHCVVEIDEETATGSLPARFQRTLSLTTAESGQKPVADSQQSSTRGLDIVQGDITRFDKADVLVNSIAGDETDFIGAGAVSKAFAKAGGSQLQEEFSAAGGFGKHDIVITSAPGTLKAKRVFHVALKRYAPRQNCTKVLQQKIQDCIGRAVSLSMTSIAFPTLGCGNLHFPVEKVAYCFKSAAASVRDIKIYLVVPDVSLCQNFKDLCAASLGHARSQSQSSFPHESSTFSDPVAKSSTVTFSIYAPSKQIASDVKTQLEGKLESLVHRSSVKFSIDLNASQLQRLRSLQSSQVAIKIDTKRKTIELSGLPEKVDEKHLTIDQLLTHFAKTSTDLNYILQVQGRKEYVKALCSQPEVTAPGHWKSYHGNLTDVVSPHGKLVPVDGALKGSVTSLVMKTWSSKKVGGGYDAQNLRHQGISVKNVWQIENVSLYKSYVTHLKELHKHNASGNVPAVKGLQGEKEIKTILKGDSELEKLLILPELNECFLFHGTDQKRKDAIVNQGIDYRLGNNTALFGQGCYFAESSTKADQYADPKDARVGLHKPLYMFVFRVVLGRTYVCREPRQFKRPPCTDAGCCSDMCAAHSLYDSVIGTHNFIHGAAAKADPMSYFGQLLGQKQATRKLWFREFVVYEQQKCYPEFLVEYERI